MKGIQAIEGDDITDWVAIVVHGSTQSSYDANHPLVACLRTRFSTIYSIDLPGHGSLQLKSDRELTYEEANSQYLSVVLPCVERRKIVYVGFSLGAIFAIKNWKELSDASDELIGIFIGTGLHFSETSLQNISMFFTVRHYRISGWVSIMEELHGPYWQTLLSSIRKWFSPEASPNILYSSSEIETVLGSNTYFIVGNRDQAFGADAFYVFSESQIIDLTTYTPQFLAPSPPDPLRGEPLHRVYLISGHHFSYFHPKAAFPIVAYVLNDILDKTCFS